MDNQRLFLFAGLGFLLLLIYQNWQMDYGVDRQTAVQSSTRISPMGQTDSVANDIPQAALQSKSVPSMKGGVAQEEVVSKGQRIAVYTDTFQIIIDSQGGGINQVLLSEYPISPDQPDVPFQLMDDRSGSFFIAQSGLQAAKGDAPTHHALFQVKASEFRLEEGKDELRVPLYWSGDNGVEVIKTYVFHRNSYLIDVEYQLKNGSDQPWRGRQYRQLQRKFVGEDEQPAFIYTYIGGVLYSEAEKYEKIDFSDMEEADLNRSFKGGWAAMIQHYFLASWVPAVDEENTFYTKVVQSNFGKRYVMGLYSAAVEVAPNDSVNLSSQLFVGPKDQARLEAIQESLKLTVDYGILTIIAQPIFWLLKWLHSFLGNWGWAIIFVTLIIKLIFYKLSEASYRSMANMRRLQPKLQALKERHGDDRQKMGQATMDLYRKEKINPLGGCLPMLVQIPVFIALYWVLLESVEMRQAPFMLWVTDLSAKDPYFVLPLIMGVSMFVQQKLNPAPIDPVQQKIFMIMPVAFTFFFAFFPSGLVLYWAVNNLLSIAQQWYITRHVLAGEKKK
ncbi:MAG: membrane protein insertase YidC [Gammaproteobacteria bacterium]|nr:membrane protein insertase YidC [Gammaproteobacteria bacterium]